MALNLDPITGLPSDFLAPDLYQIPLNSRPQLAPEWSPDHLPPNALHPDNMPSMFATVQAQNSLNPELPQACTTDGAGNLNVNVKAGGGGGGGGGSVYGAMLSASDWFTTNTPFSEEHIRFLFMPRTIWRLRYDVVSGGSNAGAGQAIAIQMLLLGHPSLTQWDMGYTWFTQPPGFNALDGADVRTVDVLYPGGWSTAGLFDPADTQLWVSFRPLNGGFFPGGSALMEYSS